MGDKYDAPPILFVAFLHLRDHTVEDPVHVFDAAVAYGNLDLARHALKSFDHTYSRTLRASSVPDGFYVSGSTRKLADVPDRFLDRFSRAAMLSFAKMQEGVYDGKWTWKTQAEHFVVRALRSCRPASSTRSN